MSFFSKIFGKKKTEPQAIVQDSPEVKSLFEFELRMDTLLAQDRFIARSDFAPICRDFAPLYDTFCKLQSTGMLPHFCQTVAIKEERVVKFLSHYSSLSSKDASEIKQHNKEFINRHLEADSLYLDNILKKVDPVIKLDDEQRCVVLSDEDYMLVIAGAGAGKTTTIAAKVKYLVEKRGIKPDEIMVISFTNKAVDELRDKINKALKINCPITTFHKTGFAIISRQEPQKLGIVDSAFMFNVINNYLKGNILENPELVDKLILFFGSYFDAPYEGDDLNDFFNYITKADFSTLKGNMSEYADEIIDKRTGRCITIVYETLRSQQEVMIANFLYLNGIEYTYEKIYPYNIIGSNKPYTPDFTITQGNKIAYIEHFGLTEDERNNRYTKEQIEKYKKAVNDKVKLHRSHNTDLIYTFSAYNDGRSLLDHLKEKLIEHGFELNPRQSKEVFEKIVSTEENKYIARLVKLVCTFIQNFKTNGYTVDAFGKFAYNSKNERTKLFLDICERCYYEYSKRLKERNAIDFADMINLSARIIRNKELKGEQLKFKYIIVDEYQDISRQRFNLTKELSKLCNAKIVAVGDDWQSIYAYAGSDITLFTQFKETFGYGDELSITKTYRNAQEVIDIAGGFVQKNCSQIKKALISPKHIVNPVVVKTYTENVDRKKYAGKGGKYFLIGETVETIMDEILKENPNSSILLLGRYGFDAYNLGRSADFRYDEQTGNVYSQKYNSRCLNFMTVHRAKGLGYDNVIIINGRNDIYGFPSKIEDDPVLNYVVKLDHSIEHAEERRLFYVALTRTKNRVYIVTPQQHPSEFVLEMINEYPAVKLDGDIVRDAKRNIEAKRCPVCGYPMQFRYKKAYGLRLWICSNEPEICDFMTNNINGGDMPILKCDKCKDGYLIVKEAKENPFLGCTNYKADGTGCNNCMTRNYYKRNILGINDCNNKIN